MKEWKLSAFRRDIGERNILQSMGGVVNHRPQVGETLAGGERTNQIQMQVRISSTRNRNPGKSRPDGGRRGMTMEEGSSVETSLFLLFLWGGGGAGASLLLGEKWKPEKSGNSRCKPWTPHHWRTVARSTWSHGKLQENHQLLVFRIRVGLPAVQGLLPGRLMVPTLPRGMGNPGWRSCSRRIVGCRPRRASTGQHKVNLGILRTGSKRRFTGEKTLLQNSSSAFKARAWGSDTFPCSRWEGTE